jgi:hypothetical protein
MSAMTPEKLRQAGLDALRRELGVPGMARFLQQFAIGSGDYTTERSKWLPTEVDVANLVALIKEYPVAANESENTSSEG